MLETKEQSKQWTTPGETAAKMVKSSDKVMGTIFWDANEIIFIWLLIIKNRMNDEWIILCVIIGPAG